jgi:hypothetical protein
MPPLAIIEQLDIAEQARFRLGSRGIAHPEHQFDSRFWVARVTFKLSPMQLKRQVDTTCYKMAKNREFPIRVAIAPPVNSIT